MNTISEILKYIIPRTMELNKIHIPDESTRVNYSAIFCQSDIEYEKLNREAAAGYFVDLFSCFTDLFDRVFVGIFESMELKS